MPLRKPLLNLRETSLSVLMRPVPVVFLLLAFSAQLSVDVLEYDRVGGIVDRSRSYQVERSISVLLRSYRQRSQQRENVHFLMEAEGYPQLAQVFFWTWRERLPVESQSNQLMFFLTNLHLLGIPILRSNHPSHSLVRPLFSLHVPQRLHRTCVLLWRLPKLEVPLAISIR